MRAALNALSVVAPDWLREQADPAWTDRYAKPTDDYHIPTGEAARRACAEGIGCDGYALLALVSVNVVLPRFAWIMPQAERAVAAGRSWHGRSFDASAA